MVVVYPREVYLPDMQLTFCIYVTLIWTKWTCGKMELEFCQLNRCGQITLLCGFSVDILKMGKMIFS